MQIKSAGRYHLTQLGWLLLKKKENQKITNADKDVEKLEPCALLMGIK